MGHHMWWTMSSCHGWWKATFARVKGHDINWAKAITCTTREKARKESTKKMQTNSIKLELSKFSKGEVSCKSKGDVLMSKGKYVR